MNSFDIASGRTSTTIHAAPGGRSTFTLAHDSGNAGMTPRESAALRKADRQAESDRQYLAASQALGNDGKRIVSSNSNIFDDNKPSEAPKTDLYKLSAPFADAVPQQRNSTRVHAAPGGRQTLVLGDDSPTDRWGKADDFNKAKPMFKPRDNGNVHPEMAVGGLMANILNDTNAMPMPQATMASGPPDTSEMSHKERIAAMKTYRSTMENGGVPLPVQKQFTAGKNDGMTHTSECSIGERPSSRVLAPPGGRSTFTLG
ncbi:hypothetical protein T492DRAFT_1042998 [Pavlovales sp. CCMP2436]|nr:hypothetical protein T492DRAFT_1042998 [Pavlovales sp. CCMP2436]|mmetsp:Transcript_43315/g.106984  ORF Transcript_43315/g.106984 Transcript_43315/m.106984 type:complete len:258 (-) Transcript_43315:232-1005(-)